MAALINGLTKFAQVSLGAGVIAGGAQLCLFDVDAGHRAIVYNVFNGVEERVRGEGTWPRIPYIDTPYMYDVRIKPHEIASSTGTKDLQQVNLVLRALVKPDEKELPTVYRQLGLDFGARVLPSIVNEVVKAVMAKYDAVNLLIQRDQVSREIRNGLEERAEEFHLLVEDVAITHLAFGKEFERAIEQKQVAQQEAERAKFLVEKTQQEKEAAVIRAEGEAEAAIIISEALKNSGTGGIEVRRIEAAQHIADTLARSRNVTYLPGKNQNLLIGLNK
jgi:prohibitin 1